MNYVAYWDPLKKRRDCNLRTRGSLCAACLVRLCSESLLQGPAPARVRFT
ncbi:hypothetical protein LEMLEM_LOCUS14779 [Lemmus lemmus]